MAHKAHTKYASGCGIKDCNGQTEKLELDPNRQVSRYSANKAKEWAFVAPTDVFWGYTGALMRGWQDLRWSPQCWLRSTGRQCLPCSHHKTPPNQNNWKTGKTDSENFDKGFWQKETSLESDRTIDFAMQEKKITNQTVLVYVTKNSSHAMHERPPGLSSSLIVLKKKQQKMHCWKPTAFNNFREEMKKVWNCLWFFVLSH